jgi:putative ABC transport system permease protein
LEKLFGVEMNVLAGYLAGGTIFVLVAVFLLALRNKVLLKLALRNIPRRKAQSILIVVGLMLSTTIIMSALAIGDSVSSSIRSAVLDAVGETDVRLTSPVAARFGDDYLDASLVERVRAGVEGDLRVDGVMPIIRERLPVLHELTDKTVAGTSVVGIDLSSLAGFDGLKNVDGDAANLSGLSGDGTTIINRALSKKLDADVGSDITLVAPSGRRVFRVIDVVEDKGLAGGDEEIRSAALFSVGTLQSVLDREGQYNMIEVSVAGGLRVDEDDSDDLTEELQLLFINDEAATALFNALKTPAVVEALQAKLDEGGGAGGPFSSNTLAELVAELENDAPTDEFKVAVTNTITIAIVGGVIEGLGDPELAQSLLIPASQLVDLQVVAIKNQGLAIAELVGGFIVALFSIFGSFSIIVGLLLIFLVFVMLAAARTTEMGIIRAVGTKRRHLVQMFAYEGIVYSIGAALLGTVLGLLASVALVGIMSGLVAEDDGFGFSYNVTLQSVVVAFSLGLVLTAITVAVSAYRVSKLNIVVAIRGLGQEFVQDEVPGAGKRFRTALKWLGGPLAYGFDTWRQRRPNRSTRSILVLMAIVPAGVVVFLMDMWKSRKEGRGVIPRLIVFSLWMLVILQNLAATVAPDIDDSVVQQAISMAIVFWFMIFVWKMFKFVQPWLASGWPLLPFGALVALLGFDSDHGLGFGVGNAALFTSGTTLLIIGIGLAMRQMLDRRGYREEFQKRVSMSFIGIVMLIFWGLPFDALDGLTGTLPGGPEMFLLSGVSLVAAAVWTVMYNADVIVWVVSKMIGRFGSLRPVVKMAIAYPMSARFRTGLTLAMFSLVIFTMMIFAILTNLGNAIEDEPDLVSGGFDIRSSIDLELPIDDVDAVIANSGGKLSASDFEVISRQASLRVEARQDGAEDLAFKNARVRASDDTWLTNNNFELTHWDPAYGSTSAEIWAAVAADSSLAVVNGNMIETGGFGGGGEPGSGPALGLKGIKANEPGEISGVDIKIRPPVGQGVGDSVDAKVIGVLHQFADSFEFGSTDIYMNPDILSEVSSKPVPFTAYKFRLADDSRAEEITRVLETVFIEHGMTASATAADIAENQSQNAAFNQLFQGFMGLGLLVGVASLGVVSFRAVVERRQSIGMMRALGYKGRMIQIQFLMESGIVAIFGAAIGIGLGALIGWNIFLSISAEADGLTYSIPWLNVTLIVFIAVVFSLVTTFIPARQASKIKPSEALRY